MRPVGSEHKVVETILYFQTQPNTYYASDLQ